MKLLSNLSLKWKLSLGFGILLGLMVTVSSTVYLNLREMKTSSQWVEHTHEAIRLGDEITLSLVNMETGLRGFLMAGKDQFLEPYDLGQNDFAQLMATAKKHVSDNQAQVARLNEIEQLKQRWESEHVNVAIAMRREVNENSDAIQTFKEISAKTVGKEKFDGFRAALSKLDEKFIQSNDIKAQSLVKLLLIDMINQETGQRGFLLSGKEESLEPYDEGKKAFDNHISNMNDLIQHAYDRVEAKENVDAVKQIISDWEHKVALVGIELRKQSAAGQLSNDYVTEFVLKGTGKQFFDQSRENIAALTEEFKTSNDLLALELVTRLAKNMVDMETGYRGFLLTGKPSSLEPYNSGKVDFQKTLGAIEQLIAKAYNVEEANTLLNAAVELAKDWDTHAAQPEIEARQEMNKVARTVDDIANFVELGIGKKHMDAMREELKAFIGAEFALIGERSEKNHTVADNTTTVTLVGTLLAAGFGGLLALFLVRNITRTLNQAGTIANKIADDDYSTEISAPSQDELGQLIESLGTMQSKLKQRTETERRVAAENNRIKQALDNVSGNVMILDDKLDIIYTNHSIERMFRSGAAQFTNHLPSFNTSLISGQNISVLLPQHQVLNKLTKTEVLKTQVGQNTYEITANSVLNDEHAPVAVVLEWKDRSQELAIESEIQNVVDSSRSGDLSQRIDLDGKRGFQAMLSQGINDLVNASELVINDSLHVMHALSHGDLTKSIDANYEGTFELLKQDTNASIEKLTGVVTEIRGSADAVLTATRQMAHGNMNLSQRTEEQASNLQSTSSSMEEMTATVKQNADSARQANKLAVNACSQAVKGQDIVISAVTAMEQITTSSEQIADIIGVIDEIAFQTNLLALNAAVEAARAGEQGRGFAVVASEVRTLASRSAEAAKEIKELIEDSVTKVNEGAKLVNDSGETLQQITGSVTQVSDIIGQIASASEEQSLGIEQVNNAITQLDNTTQQNAALVEEAAASSELMEQQAEKLNNLVGFFSMQSDKRFAARGNSRDHNESVLV